MVDYVSSFTKKLKKHKVIAGVFIIVLAIILIANFLGALKFIYEFFSPTMRLSVRAYTGEFIPTYNENKTAFIGLNATFPTQITNTGKVPVHIVACDVFMKPVDVVDEKISEITYLKPQDSFSYNITKYFDVMIPLNSTEDVTPYFTDYVLLVMYADYSNPLDIRSVWADVLKINP